MGHRSPGDEGESLIFDLLDDDEVAFESDVTLTGNGGSGPRRRVYAALAGLVVVAVGAVAVFGPDDHRRADSPTTTTARGTTAPGPIVPDTTAPSTTAPGTTAASGPAVTVTTTAVDYVPLPEFAVDPGYRVHLVRPDSALGLSFDLTSGRLVPLLRAYVRGATMTSNGLVFSTANEVVAPDGTVWSVENGILLAATVDEFGQRTLRATFGLPDSLAADARLRGVSPEGRPVIRGPDLSGYVVGDDGSISRPIEGILAGVGAGGLVTFRCDEQAVCRVVADSVQGPYEVPVGSDAAVTRLVEAAQLSPDGRWLVLIGARSSLSGETELTIYDSATANTYTSPFDRPFDDVVGASAWSPDGRYFFFVAEGRLMLFDTESTTFRIVPTTRLLSFTAVAGVG